MNKALNVLMTLRGATPLSLFALAAVCFLGALFVACQGGDDSTSSPTARSSTGGTAGGPEPMLPGPAAKYAANLVDLKAPYKVDPNETYNYLVTSFAAQGPFKSEAEGEQLAKQWEITDGFKSSYIPDGQLSGVLEGRYYLTVETFLFNKVSGATQAYARFAEFYGGKAGVDPVASAPLANQSNGYKLVQGTVGNSGEVAVYYRFVFRRGNMVGVVQTFGKNTALTIAQARDIAVLMDERALGKRDASIPTAVPTSALLPTVGP